MAGVLFMQCKMDEIIEEKGLKYWDDNERKVRHITTDAPLSYGERAFVEDYMSVVRRGFDIVFDELDDNVTRKSE